MQRRFRLILKRLVRDLDADLIDHSIRDNFEIGGSIRNERMQKGRTKETRSTLIRALFSLWQSIYLIDVFLLLHGRIRLWIKYPRFSICAEKNKCVLDEISY